MHPKVIEYVRIHHLGPMDMRRGGKIPGKAPVPTGVDSPKADRVPILGSPGEVMLPRSVSQAPDAPARARAFVAELQRRRASKMAEGGEVRSGGILDAVKNWVRSKRGDVEAARGVDQAIDQALPNALGAKDAIQKNRERLQQIDEQTKDMANGGELHKPKLGTGKRFAAVEQSAAASGARDPAAVAAVAGRAAHGARQMAKWAKAGAARAQCAGGEVEHMAGGGVAGGLQLTPPQIPQSAPQPSPPPQAQGVTSLTPEMLQALTTYPAGLDLEGLKAAQAADLQRQNLQGLGQAGERAAATAQGRAPNFEGLTPDQLNVRNFTAQRQLAGEDLARKMQAAMIPITYSGKLAELQKTLAEGQNAASQAAINTFKTSPIPDEHIARLTQSGFAVPQGTTWGQLSEYVAPIQKSQELAVERGRLGVAEKELGLKEWTTSQDPTTGGVMFRNVRTGEWHYYFPGGIPGPSGGADTTPPVASKPSTGPRMQPSGPTGPSSGPPEQTTKFTLPPGDAALVEAGMRKHIPPEPLNELTRAESAMQRIQTAMEAAKSHPESFGPAANWASYLPTETLREPAESAETALRSPKDVSARAPVFADAANAIADMHAKAGNPMTAEQLRAFIPQKNENAQQILAKLQREYNTAAATRARVRSTYGLDRFQPETGPTADKINEWQSKYMPKGPAAYAKRR